MSLNHASPLLANDTLFPYGTKPIDDDVLAYYKKHALSRSYPFPDEMPNHHPLLQACEGVTPCEDHLPPWWADWIAWEDPCCQDLLASISLQEYRRGTLDEARWKQWKKQQVGHFPSPLAPLTRSPRLHPLLEETPWKDAFLQRGPESTPPLLDLHISTKPEAFLAMSNGDSWITCQHLISGGDNEHLPGNLYDTGVAVAMLVERGMRLWEPKVVRARTLLRVMRAAPDLPPTLVIGRAYGNNLTLQLNLLHHLVTCCDEHQVHCAFLEEEDLMLWLTAGSLGEALRARKGARCKLFGEPFWLPRGCYPPYIDGSHQWREDDDGLFRLEGWVYPFTPPSVSPTPPLTAVEREGRTNRSQ